MANKTGKYNSFKQWLMWCRGKNQASATKLASYLRRLESDLLLKLPEPRKCRPFHELHQMLLDIDRHKAVGFSIDDVVEELKKILTAIDNERKEEDIRNQVSEVEPEVLDDWRGAFNAYLKYLSDITECFTMDDAKQVNEKIEIGGHSTCYDERLYHTRLKLFKHGVYKCIVDNIGMANVVDKVLDAFSESIDILTMREPYEVPTQFIVEGSTQYEIGDWRAIIIDNIRYSIEDDTECCNPFSVERVCSAETTARLLAEILYYVLMLNNEVASYVYKDTNQAISVKDTLCTIKKSDVERIRIPGIANSISLVRRLISDYAACFKITLFTAVSRS